MKNVPKYLTETMDIIELQEIFQLDNFLKEIKELSSWAANIKQEAPILHILAKILHKNGYKVALEIKTKSEHGIKSKSDMLINGTIVEAKFYYEEDIYQQIRLLMKKANNDFSLILKWLKQKIENKQPFQFQPIWYILKDIFYKELDIFILIFLSRNLKHVPEQDLETINWSDNCLNYNKEFGYNNQNIFIILDELLAGIKKEKAYEYSCVDIDVNTNFPSTYHIHIFNFRKKD